MTTVGACSGLPAGRVGPVASGAVFTATLLALASAFIHAAWNLIVKTSGDRQSAGWGRVRLRGAAGAARAGGRGPAGRAALPWLALSAGVHLLYLDGLTGAYTHGDFSLSYPMARGGGAVLAAVGGVALLGDDFSGIAWAAVGIVALGLMSLRGRGRASGLGWALFTACCIGTYTLIDAHGARGRGQRCRLRAGPDPPLRPGDHRGEPGPGPWPRPGRGVAREPVEVDGGRGLHRDRLHPGA